MTDSTETPQEELDRNAKLLWRMKERAEKEAMDACKRGDFHASERLHMIAAKLHEAYALGRGLNMQSGGGIIQPFGGGGK
jgi:hypothetical protein